MIDESTASAVAEYNPIAAGLAECRQRYAGVVYDLRTTKGNDDARKARKELVTLRTSLESKRKELKAPLLAQAKLVDDEAKRITGELLALEQPIDEQIKADERRREEERRAREEAERARVAAIRERIAEIAAAPAKAASLRSSALMSTAIEAIKAQEIDEATFAEFEPEARNVRLVALNAMLDMLSGLQAQEAEAERLKAEREALERAEREAAERRAEEERVAREQREAEVARLRAEREAFERQQAEAAARRAEQERADAAARKAEEDRLREAREQFERDQESVRQAQAAEAARIAEQQQEIARQQAVMIVAQQPKDEPVQEPEPAAEAVAEVVAMPAKQGRARPTDAEIIEALALHFRVHEMMVIEWLLGMDLEAASEREAALL